MERSITASLVPSGPIERQLPEPVELRQTCCVVIDVLRATTVMVTAGDAGVRRIRTCGEIDEAMALADQSSERPLLCGERECKRIAGFDLGNSPAEYGPDVVAGREMILTTTNGTRAIRSAMPSKRLLVASFLNLDATVRTLRDERHVHLVCAGTGGEISYEDVLLAGLIVERLEGSGITAWFNDPARIARSCWRQIASRERPLTESLRASLRESLGGRNLIAAGFDEDIERCARMNTIDGVVERYRVGEPFFEFVR